MVSVSPSRVMSVMDSSTKAEAYFNWPYWAGASRASDTTLSMTGYLPSLRLMKVAISLMVLRGYSIRSWLVTSML
ncbi:hypothetical protein D3C71_1903040 [compost metagenome]